MAILSAGRKIDPAINRRGNFYKEDLPLLMLGPMAEAVNP